MTSSFESTEVVDKPPRESLSLDEELIRNSSAGRTSAGNNHHTGAGDRTSFDVEAAGRDSAGGSRNARGIQMSRMRPQSAFLLETLGAEEEESVSETTSVREDAAEPQRKKSGERIYYLDWLRILAIYLVVFYHCIQGLEEVKLWPSTPERLHVIAYKSSSLQVGMPVFFHISGRAQALTKQKPMRTTIVTRFQRLIVPFLVGQILLIPFWQYVLLRDKFPESPRWYIAWLFWFFQPGNYIFHVGWLWFLPTLFVIGILAVPIFLFAEERSAKYAIISAAVWIVFSGLLGAFSNFSWVMLTMAALGPIAASTVVMFVPFPARNSNSWSSERWLAVQLTTFLTILTQLGVVCSFSYEEISAAWKPVPAFILFTSFYVHGYFVQRWNVGAAEAERLAQAARLLAERNNREAHRSWDDSQNGGLSSPTRSHAHYAQFAEKLPLWAGVWQLLVVGIMLLSVSVGSPVGEMQAELFPIYSASYKDSPFFGAAHVSGTWAMIGLVVSWFQAYANKEFHPLVYKHGTTSVIVVYIFHWVFIAPFAFWVCRDFGLMEGGWKLIDPLITLAVACSGSLGLYVLLLRFPNVGKLFGM